MMGEQQLGIRMSRYLIQCNYLLSLLVIAIAMSTQCPMPHYNANHGPIIIAMGQIQFQVSGQGELNNAPWLITLIEWR